MSCFLKYEKDETEKQNNLEEYLIADHFNL